MYVSSTSASSSLSSSTSPLSALLKRICVFRVHLIECIWTSCSAKACMIYDGLWHANVWFGLVMMSIYDGNTKKKPRQNSQLLFTIHCTHFKSASHSSIFLPNTLTCLVPPQRSTNDIIIHLILYNIFSQRFSIFPLNLFTFFSMFQMSLSFLRWHVSIFYAFHL